MTGHLPYLRPLTVAGLACAALAACSASTPPGSAPAHGSTSAVSAARHPATPAPTAATAGLVIAAVPGRPLPVPVALVPFASSGPPRAWRPAGRPVGGIRAVYETTLVPPGGTSSPGSRGWTPACCPPGCTRAR